MSNDYDDTFDYDVREQVHRSLDEADDHKRNGDCRCPYCGEWCEAEHVDVGVGPPGVQVEPYVCYAGCGAMQVHPYNDDMDALTEEERRIGWHAPGKLDRIMDAK